MKEWLKEVIIEVYVFKYTLYIYNIHILVISIILFIVLLLIINNNLYRFKKNIHILYKNNCYINDVFSGIYICGAAGCAKTRAILVKHLMPHYKNYKFSNLVYCYKNDELIKYGLPNLLNIHNLDEIDLNNRNFYIIAPANSEITDKINILDPKYFLNDIEIESFIIQLINSSEAQGSGKDSNPFFKDAAISAINGFLILFINLAKNNNIFKDNFCNLPYFFSTLSFLNRDELINLLKTDGIAFQSAQAFANAEKETFSSIMATIGNFINKFTKASIYYTFYDENNNYIDYNINNNQKTIFILNNLAAKNSLYPIINSLIHLAIQNAMKTPANIRIPTSLIIDEGSTINLKGFSEIPATLRSLMFSLVFMIQDLSLAEEKSNNITPRAIIANLSAQFFGKINDSKTGAEYEKILGKIKKRRDTYNFGAGLINSLFSKGSSYTLEDKNKFETADFTKLKSGEFVFFSNGISKKKQFDYKRVQEIESLELLKNYENIEKANILYENIVNKCKNKIVYNFIINLYNTDLNKNISNINTNDEIF